MAHSHPCSAGPSWYHLLTSHTSLLPHTTGATLALGHVAPVTDPMTFHLKGLPSHPSAKTLTGATSSVSSLDSLHMG